MSQAPHTCAARPGADQQMRCNRCGLVWDLDDPEPPTCRPEPVQKPFEAPPMNRAERRRKQRRLNSK